MFGIVVPKAGVEPTRRHILLKIEGLTKVPVKFLYFSLFTASLRPLELDRRKDIESDVMFLLTQRCNLFYNVRYKTIQGGR